MNQCATGIFVFVSANPRRQPNRCPNKHHDKRRQTTTTKSKSTKSAGPFAARLAVLGVVFGFFSFLLVVWSVRGLCSACCVVLTAALPVFCHVGLLNCSWLAFC